MANRKVTLDVSDNILAASILASFPLNKRDRLIENHADHDKVTFKGTNKIPLMIGDIWYYCDTDVNISTGADIDTGAVANGKDYYVYACNVAGTLEFKISLNSTNPSGVTTANSRKIGGFHTECAAIGTIAGHPLSGFSANDIIPATIWDLKHRPVCGPEGLLYNNANNRWESIYAGTGTGASTASTYGANVRDSRDWNDFVDDYAAIGCELLTDAQYQAAMAGVPEEAQVWDRSDPVTAGGHSAYFTLTLDVGPAVNWAADDTITGGTSAITCTVVECLTNLTYVCKNISDAAGFTLGEILSNGVNTADQGAAHPTWAANATGRIVSHLGHEDGPGTWYSWLDEQSAKYDGAIAASWYDLPGDKGSLYRPVDTNDVKLLAGGVWHDAADCGSRCRVANTYRWVTYSYIAGRFGAAPQ